MRIRELMILFSVSLIVLSVIASARDGSTTLTSPPWNHSLCLRHVDGFRLGLMTAFKRRFDDPRGVFCVTSMPYRGTDDEGGGEKLTIFSVNGGNGTVLFNTNDWSFDQAGSDGSDSFTLDQPRGVTGDTLGNIFIADSGNDRIVRLFFDGKGLSLEGTIDSFCGIHLSGPSGVAVSGGRLYIADTGNDRIVIADYQGMHGEVLKIAEGGVRIEGPTSVTASSEGDGWLYYDDHSVTVIDSLGKRVRKINKDGKDELFLRYEEIGKPGGRFDDIAIDYYSNIYLTDSSSGSIHKLDRNLNHIVTLGRDDGNPMDLDEPRGISIFRRYGQVVVTERTGLRYFWVGTDLLDFEASDLIYHADTGAFSVEISFLLTEHSMVDLYIDCAGQDGPLYFARDFLLPGGRYERRIEVGGTGIRLDPDCRPRLVAVAKPTYSSTNYLTVTRKSEPLKPLSR